MAPASHTPGMGWGSRRSISSYVYNHIGSFGASMEAFCKALFLGGALAATVVTFFTFLPSFVFILAGGPLVEATHGKLGFTAPLSAITAAVVGVILNLAMFFAYHVLWPRGFGGPFDVLSAVITMAAAVALFRFKVGVIPLLGACASTGLVATWLLTLLR